MLWTTVCSSGMRVSRYRGVKTLIWCPAAARARGKAPTTSASPPVLEKGTHSEATNAMCMGVPADHAAFDYDKAWSRFRFGSQSNWQGERGSMKASSARVPQKKPKLGQHFLNDSSAALRIVHALGDISQSTVLEIGPGGGALTSMLVRRARRVIAIETDRV